MRFFYLKQIMNIEEIYRLFLKCREVSTDSRKCAKNALFFALRGENFNGNKYAEQAIENGCSYAIIDDENYRKDIKYILVKDVLETLQKLANYHRKRLNIPIIAITGTNGKTTTKELISSVLSQKFSITNTVGNLNNHIGVPITLLSMDESTQIGIVEMGANHPNEIMQLCKIAEPNYGIITNIGKAHLEGFGSFEKIISTKNELYNYLNESNGTAFFNANNDLLLELTGKLKTPKFDFNGVDSKVKGQLLKTNKFLAISISINGCLYNVKTKLIGNYNSENVIAAACVGNYFNVSDNDIINAIEKYEPSNNRSQFIKTDKNNLYLDAYNANPTSVNAALLNFEELQVENKWIVLGDMLELGEDSISEHKKIIAKLSEMKFEKAILVGELYSSIKTNKNDILQFKNVDELIVWIRKNNISNSNVLIKGSRGIKLETIVEYL